MRYSWPNTLGILVVLISGLLIIFNALLHPKQLPAGDVFGTFMGFQIIVTLPVWIVFHILRWLFPGRGR